MGLTTKFITNQVYYQQSIHAAIAHDRANHSPPGVEVEYSQHSCATVTGLTTEHRGSKQCRRDFRRGNYDEIRKSLALIDWNDKMNNKTATECWNILRGELDSAIDSYVPMKKQGKRSKKKHLSKEAFRKIRYKQNMWRVYKHTGTDKDYDAYKEALNAATNEVRKSKRNFEHKLAQNIKSDSKSFYAYVRSKQNVRDKVGPLVDNAGNIITQGFLMAEELNMHFSSVFTREDTNSIPVPETKFKGSEGERLVFSCNPRSSS